MINVFGLKKLYTCHRDIITTNKSTNKMKKIFFFSLIFLIFIYGCRQQKQVSKRYYVIETPAKENLVLKDSLTTINKYCEVVPVVIFPAFASHKIALRGNTHEIEYFGNHEWATRPSDNLTTIIVNFFDRYKVFKGADTRYWRVIPDYRFETTIYQLEIIDDKDGFLAHLNLEFRLVDINKDKTILKHTADRYQPLDKRKINYFAEAISEMFYNELYNVSKKITTIKE